MKFNTFWIKKIFFTYGCGSLLFLASCWGVFWGYQFFYQREESSSVSIQKIVQASENYQALSTFFFAEILDLSVDHPISFSHFNPQVAEKKLLSTHLFERVYVKKIKPHTVFIDYSLRKPIGYYGEHENTLFDREGVLFPAHPFFTPKNLPRIFCGVQYPHEVWGNQIPQAKMQLICDLLSTFPEMSLQLIDLSTIDHPTLGKKQCIVTLYPNNLKNWNFDCAKAPGLIDRKRPNISYKQSTHTLRLTQKNYPKEIQHYFTLLKESLRDEKRPLIVDLRLPDIAYLSFGEENE